MTQKLFLLIFKGFIFVKYRIIADASVKIEERWKKSYLLPLRLGFQDDLIDRSVILRFCSIPHSFIFPK